MNKSSRPPPPPPPLRAPGGESPMSSLYSTVPPLHPTAGPFLSPRRREHVVQPPALTTSLSGVQYHGGGLTSYSPAPNSTTSLSSPFSQLNSSSYLPSPGGTARGSSPMAHRLSGVFNVPYNPREWAPVGGQSPNIGSTQVPQSRQSSTSRTTTHAPAPAPAPAPPRQVASDEPPAGAPPPPYSPVRNNPPSISGTSTSTSTTISPADTISPATIQSQYSSPLSVGISGSPDITSGQRYSSPRPLSLVLSSDSPNAPWNNPSFPLPPSQSSGRHARPPSKGGEKPHGLFSLSSLIGRSKQDVVSSQAPAAIDVLQHTTSEVLGRPSFDIRAEAPMRPPTARRAASAGAIASASESSTPSRSGSRSPSKQQSWEPGMPLPGPPPGPPPYHRSQSLSDSPDGSSKHHLHPPLQPRNRLPPAIGTNLDPIPPTPFGWTEDEPAVTPQKPLRTPVGTLHIDTLNLRRSTSPRAESENVNSEATVHAETMDPSTADTRANSDKGKSESSTTSVPASSGLSRSTAFRRDSAGKGIWERRSESRSGKERAMTDGSLSPNNPWAKSMETGKPVDLNLQAGEPGLVRRRTPTTSTSRGSRGSKSPPPSAGQRQTSGGMLSATDSSKSTPRAIPARLPHLSTQTPPFSPGGEPCSPTMPQPSSFSTIPPKALPTPPPQRLGDSSYLGAATESQERPVSHILHVRDDDSMVPAPLVPSRPGSQLSGTIGATSQTEGDSSFVREALQRYRSVLEREESATSEAEKLQLFVDFISSESRFRRVQYASCFSDGSFDVPHAQSRIFESRSVTSPRASDLPEPMSPLEPSSPFGLVDLSQNRPDSAWWNNYKPSLSPIASMSQSNEELSSRGRPSSRWWESTTGSDGPGRMIQRSKRESKYMGLPREVREQMQWENAQRMSTTSVDNVLNSQGVDQVPVYGENEYPPEKVGWQEGTDPQLEPRHASSSRSRPAPLIKLDVSRLVTLPPPYPRHYPAVNNSHPDLVSYRTLVRSVMDLSGISASKERFEAKIASLQQGMQEKIRSNRREFKANIQGEIDNGSLSYAEAAEAEAALRIDERELEKECAQTEFDLFQEDVLKPSHDTLTSRIHQTTFYIDELGSKLSNDAQRRSPNQTQEEGDEQPESLEKLTQLKWLFEARESLHREVYDLLSTRNDKYKSIVILPYRQSDNEEKVRGTEAFFVNDAHDRRVQFETETLKRYETFQSIIEENVVRGVEEQLSAFWDIAPALVTLLQQIPSNLDHFTVYIPPSELNETPSYHAHPLQYLYSLLSHATKSTYQFIESQTNLLCLLHEVKSSVMHVGCGLMAVQRIKAGDNEKDVRAEMEETKSAEERDLTADLQEKVRTVECQWREALGAEVEGVKGRVKEWLVEAGGWEDFFVEESGA